MKKAVPIILGCICIFFLGCANDEYAIEKRFYYVQKQAAKIFKNPDASPPNELNRVVALLDNFAGKYPKNNLALEAQFNIARLYIVKKEYQKARAQLNNMVNQYSTSEPICSEALFLKGNSYEIEDKWNSAQGEYQEIIQKYPFTLRGLSTPIYIAQHYKIKYQPDKMIEAYKEAGQHYQVLLNKYPDSPLAYTVHQLLAQCYIETKDWQNAVDAFSAIIKKYKDKARLDAALMNMAFIYKNELKDNIKATQVLEQLLKEYPKGRFAKTASALLKEINTK